MVADFKIEAELWSRGYHRVAGIDEAGRGPLAGPVAVAALILPPDPRLEQKLLGGVRDSKCMTPAQRRKWAEVLRQIALTWSVAFASPQEIDSLGIQNAVYLATRRALAGLSLPPDHLILDYFRLPECPYPQQSYIHGDALSLSIAGASILAKTARDDLMCQLDAHYPGYGFASHKGYGTAAHLQALQHLGPCPIHRRSFAPLRRRE
jgi:ribonuclease HII